MDRSNYMSNDDTSEDNLIEIKRKQKALAAQEKILTDQQNSIKKSKIPFLVHGELEAHLIKYLTRESNEQMFFGPGLVCSSDDYIYKFKVYVPDENSKDYQILKYTEGFVKEIHKLTLSGEFDRQVAKFADYPETLTAKYCFSGDQTLKMVNKILRGGYNRINELPLPYGYKSDPGYFFERRNYDPVFDATEKQFPFLNSYLERMTNKKALCQVVGSILAGKSLRKSPIVLYGDTGAGKSVFFKFLKKLIGELRVGIVPKTLKDMFAHGYVDNGSVAYFADEANCDYFFTDTFKEISGSETFPVRKMNRDYKVVPIRGVYLFNMNVTSLKLPKDDAVVRGRIVPCRIYVTSEWNNKVSIKDDDKLFARAAAEFKYFAGYCLTAFYKLKGGAVEYELDDIEDYIDDPDIEIEELFDTRFEFIRDYNIPGIKHKEIVTVQRFSLIWEEICRKYPSTTRTMKITDLKKFIIFKLKLSGRVELSSRIEGTNTFTKVIRGIKERPQKKKYS